MYSKYYSKSSNYEICIPFPPCYLRIYILELKIYNNLSEKFSFLRALTLNFIYLCYFQVKIAGGVVCSVPWAP